jgi:hypothetical protein
MVHLTQLKSLNDFKLLQLSWVYDINFTSTLELIKERNLLEQLAMTLPQVPAVANIVVRVHEYLDRRLAADAVSC